MPNHVRERNEYDLTLVVNGVKDVTDEIADAIYMAGGDDALVSVRSGRMYVTFSRLAFSMKEAVNTAIRDLDVVGIPAELMKADDYNKE